MTQTVKSIVLVLSLSSVACHGAVPVRTEDGYKTPRVQIARYPKAMIGYSLRFKFESVMNADRLEVSDFLSDYGCEVYQGGGYPGAYAYAICEGVKDGAGANKKILEILPSLDRLMADLDAGRKIQKSAATATREKKQKEESALGCAPDSYLGMTINGTPYRCDRASLRWVVDEVARAEIVAYDARRDKLAFALRSRVLTAKEMEEVSRLGIGLYLRDGVVYMQEEVEKRLNEDLLQQFRIRAAAEKTVEMLEGENK